MMFLTPGISFTPRCTACETIFIRHWPARLPTPAMDLSLATTCSRIMFDLRFCRITEHNIKLDIGTRYLDIARFLARHVVAAGIGIYQFFQRALNLRLR